MKKPIPYRFDVENIDPSISLVSEYSGCNKSEVARAAMVLGLQWLEVSIESLKKDEVFLMIHNTQELTNEMV